MMLDVTDVLLDPDFVEPMTVLRYGAGQWVSEGVWQKDQNPQALDPAPLGSIQAAGSDDLQVLDEGERDKSSIAVYCAQELVKGDGFRESDVIVYGGVNYRVAFSQSYPSFSIWYVVAVAVYPTTAPPDTPVPEE